MTKKESMTLYQGLNKLGNLKGVKFAYAVSKNITALQKEMDILDKSYEGSERFKKFELERLELVKKFAKKNDQGGFMIKDGQYELEDEKAFNEAFENLKKENQEVVDEREKQMTEFNALMATESDITLFKIAFTDVPADISVNQMHSISPIIEEATESPYAK